MYDTYDIAQRVKQEAKSQKIAVKEMLGACGLGINALSQMAKGQIMSSINLARIADYLDCSVDYLLGRTADPKSHHPAPPTADEDFDPADHIVGVPADVDDEQQAQ